MELRVVLFEDDKSTLKSLSRLLSYRGYQVLAYPDPSICPLYLNPSCHCPKEESCADILITDNNMLKMTGLEFVELQQQRGCKGIIHNKAVVSGAWTPEEEDKARRLGCMIFNKPLRWSDFESWLDECEMNIAPSRKLINL